MANSLLLGPLLGLESNALYTVCFLTDKSVSRADVRIANQQVTAQIVDELYSGLFWRAELEMPPQPEGHYVDYQVYLDDEVSHNVLGDEAWRFYLPGQQEKPRIAYASCNGFSDYKQMSCTDNPYALWQAMADTHREEPFSLLIMGGDQVYADAIWSNIEPLRKWNELERSTKVSRKATKAMKVQIDRFYSTLYVDRWNRPDIARMLASIPSIMMWDDHDIFDGWGSYPEDIQNCDVYQTIFSIAARYYRTFQARSQQNASLFCRDPELAHYGFGLRFRNYHILGLDNRSERRLDRVMSDGQWDDLRRYLEEEATSGDLLLMSAVPVVYRDFSFSEMAVDATPWQEELTDDLKDHWRAREHQWERMRLIMTLLNNADRRDARTVILSGDVHIGCLGVIRDRRRSKALKIHQVVSSAIVHPAPSSIQWIGIRAVTNDDTEYLNEDRNIRADIIRPQASGTYLRTRNFATLKEGRDEKLWINWVCENQEKPCYPLQ